MSVYLWITCIAAVTLLLVIILLFRKFLAGKENGLMIFTVILLGILASAGATPKQLRGMVLREALLVSAVGIPVGIVSGIGGIGAAKDGIHLLIELVDEKAGDIGDHEGAHHRHQGGDQQQHDKDQLHMKAAKHSGSFPAARQGSRGEDFWGTRLGPGGHSMDFRDSAMSMRRSLGRIPREMTRVNSSVMTKEIR